MSVSKSEVKPEAKLIVTADEAISLLNDEGEYIHNFVQAGFTFLGCDFERPDAITAFRKAEFIEIGGPACRAMRHPIVVHEPNGRHSFFEADPAKVDAFEAARAEGKR